MRFQPRGESSYQNCAISDCSGVRAVLWISPTAPAVPRGRARGDRATAAQQVARMFALQWHQDGLRPFMVFEGKRGHGDAEIQSAQDWVGKHFAVANPVEEMIKRSKLAERTFKRRFTAATGLTPLAYVQRLRIEDAKRRLERTDAPVDDVSWRVGYEDAAFFRRLQTDDRTRAGGLPEAIPYPDFARP
jgi:transcriptional regulator GlxA family with amidase domain